VKPTSVSTPARIWLEVTPWSVAPVALPPWQASVTVPKAGPEAVDDVDPVPDEEVDDDAGGELDACVLVVPARLQPAASTAVTATAARALMAVLTGFLLGDDPRHVTPRLWHAFFEMRMLLPRCVNQDFANAEVGSQRSSMTPA
jgi:hypothetical protein